MKTYQSNYTRKQEDGRTQGKNITIPYENVNIVIIEEMSKSINNLFLLCRICLIKKNGQVTGFPKHESADVGRDRYHGNKGQALNLQTN